MIKNLIKNFLIQLGLYEKLVWSNAYIRFSRWRHPRIKQSLENEIKFLSKVTHAEWSYFDVGANIGDQTEIFLFLKAKKVLSIEPDCRNNRILNYRFSKNKKVTVFKAAVSDQEGTGEFFRLSEGNAYNTLSPKWKDLLEDASLNRFGMSVAFSDKVSVSTRTLDSLIQDYGKPNCIKIDVEGYELQVVRGLSEQINLIWFEANLPEFLDETIGCIFHLKKIAPETLFNCTRGCLGVNGIQFEFSKWIKADDMVTWIKESKCRFFEIFAKNK